jgi:cyclopropane fatty-acyl-phospholipid synthase-like methyltransferase
MKPKITTSEIQTYYDNFLDHLKHDHTHENPRHVKIKKDLKSIIKKGMNILDLGCGTGITTKYIAELNAKVTGIDLSSKLIEFAKENSIHENIEYFADDITKVDLGKQKFDLICLIDVMEHIPKENIQGLIENINKYSHENTIIYLNIPDPRLQFWMVKNYPEKLQIIDEAYFMVNILHMFSSIGFGPSKIDIYGIDFPLQYTSYIFVKVDVIFYNYQKYFKH